MSTPLISIQGDVIRTDQIAAVILNRNEDTKEPWDMEILLIGNSESLSYIEDDNDATARLCADFMRRWKESILPTPTIPHYDRRY